MYNKTWKNTYYNIFFIIIYINILMFTKTENKSHFLKNIKIKMPIQKEPMF